MSERDVEGFLPSGLRWLLRAIAAGILVQTLFYKFTAAPESVYIFTRLGVEPFGRIATGVLELIASVLLLKKKGVGLIGALLTLGLMSGAILSHLIRLGIEVQGDGGLLFGLAVTVWVCAAILVADAHREIAQVVRKW